MANQRVTIATWADAADFFTAVTLQTNQTNAAVAYADSANGAVRQIKDYLRWLAKRDEWYAETEMDDVEVRQLHFSMHPHHVHQEQQLLMPTTFNLHLPCVTGKLNHDTWLGVMPTLGLNFVVHAHSGVLRVAEEQVRAHLAKCTTSDLMRYLGVKQVELSELSIPRPVPKYKVLHSSLPQTLEEVATPLGKPIRHEKIDSVFQRDTEIDHLTQQLIKQTGSILLVGDEGVGKSTILTHSARGVIRHLRENEGPLPTHRIWATSAARLIAGMKYLGEWQARCERVVDELNSIGGWLCVDSVYDLILTGDRDPRGSLAAFFLPYLQHGQLRMVCEASPSQVMAGERMLPDFLETFTKFPIKRLEESKSSEAMQQGSEVIAEQHGLEFDAGVDNLALRLVRRFEPYRAPLAPAMQLLRRLAGTAKKNKAARVSAADAIEAYAERTGLPLDILLDQIQLQFDDVVTQLQKEVVSQNIACKSVAHVVTTFKAGLNAPQRPLGVLLFCGPTGVGKTQLAKTLGKYLFGHSRDDTLVRLDMSEYGGGSAADRLLCKPDRSPSAWIQRVRKQPFCVLLLDEIEKADAQIFDILMGLLDEGRLTDAYGRVTNFTSTIVIMTSNLGVSTTQEIGFGESGTDRFEASVREFFRPEFFNRIDSVIPFAKLSKSVCRKIAWMELQSLRKREGFTRRQIHLEFADSVLDWLLETGFDEALGARPLQRNLEQHVTAPLARYLVNQLQLRKTTLAVSYDGATGLQISTL